MNELPYAIISIREAAINANRKRQYPDWEVRIRRILAGWGLDLERVLLVSDQSGEVLIADGLVFQEVEPGAELSRLLDTLYVCTLDGSVLGYADSLAALGALIEGYEFSEEQG